jgi:hypothetical protein
MKFDKLTEAYIKVVKESKYNLYTDVLNPLHSILAARHEHVEETLDNVDELLHFLIKKNPSIQNDLLEYVKSKEV